VIAFSPTRHGHPTDARGLAGCQLNPEKSRAGETDTNT
jgi:hypothetical protein